MKIVKNVGEVINSSVLKPGSRIYCSGNAATPQTFLRQMALDTTIRDVELLSVLLLGDVGEVFSRDACQRITHRVIFNGPHSRIAVNQGMARYQLMHLSDIPRQLKSYLKPNVVLVSVSGPDNGGNYSLGTTVEGVIAAIQSVRENKGVVIVERNARIPFILGTTIPGDYIDYLFDADYDLPISPVKKPDERAMETSGPTPWMPGRFTAVWEGRPTFCGEPIFLKEVYPSLP